MPGSLLLAVPFALLGNAVWQNLFWLGALFVVARSLFGGDRFALGLMVLMLFVSPAVLQDFVTGGDLGASTIAILVGMLGIVMLVPDASVASWQKVVAAVFSGIALSSRMNNLLLVPVLFASLSRRAGIVDALTYVGVVGCAFVAVTLPFDWHDPTGFAPLHLHNKFSMFGEVPNAGILVPRDQHAVQRGCFLASRKPHGAWLVDPMRVGHDDSCGVSRRAGDASFRPTEFRVHRLRTRERFSWRDWCRSGSRSANRLSRDWPSATSARGGPAGSQVVQQSSGMSLGRLGRLRYSCGTAGPQPSTSSRTMKRARGCPDKSSVIYDIAIVGGGPGGLHAAHLLARSGFKVVVFEEHASAGDPVHCTGVLAVEAFDEFDLPRKRVPQFADDRPVLRTFGRCDRYSTPRGRSDRHRPKGVRCRRSASARTGRARPCRSGERITDVRVVGRRRLADDIERTADRGEGLRAGVRRELRAAEAARARHARDASAVGADRSAGGRARPRRSALRQRGRAKRVRVGVPVIRGQRTFARIGLMCERDAREYFDSFWRGSVRAGKRDTFGCLGGGLAPRIKMLPLGPIARTYATARAGRRRRRGAREGDDRRRNLLQPAERYARGGNADRSVRPGRSQRRPRSRPTKNAGGRSSARSSRRR